VDPAAKAQEMRARGKALVAKRRQKQLEEKEAQLATLLQIQAQVCCSKAESGGRVDCSSDLAYGCLTICILTQL
jgi:hypothetical protein